MPSTWRNCVANKLTATHRDIAARMRDELSELLGGHCVRCGKTKSLQFDHIDPRTRRWVAKSCSQRGRMRRYYEEFLEGLIQLLCKKCNQKKSDKIEEAA